MCIAADGDAQQRVFDIALCIVIEAADGIECDLRLPHASPRTQAHGKDMLLSVQ
ncbi:hypothetical protein GCM10010496_73420 [Streptomyces asoensis]|nr:hypothetical protein GCM10010496_73420 [Streptomyces asoensis]